MSQRTRSSLIGVLGVIALLGALTASGGRALTVDGGMPAVAAADRSRQDAVRGATTTRLADGRWLVAGGETTDGAVATARVIDPRTGRATPLSGLQVARTAHTATLLADGTVLIAGGRGLAGQVVATAELFDPPSNTFVPVTMAGAGARTEHTATLLTDGRVLIAGGAGPDGALTEAEIWDVARATAGRASGALAQPRRQHEAALLGDGRVRLRRGVGPDGAPVAADEWFDPATGLFTPATGPDGDRGAPRLAASLPEHGAFDVPLDVRVALRFSQPLVPETVTGASIIMSGPDGPVEVALVATERARLVFVSPRLALVPDTTYVVTIDGATDQRGVPVMPASVTLTTTAGERPADVPDEEAWLPGAKDWRSHRPDSPWRTLNPLEAPPGVTALAGQVLRLDGLPLPDVTLEMEGRTTRTDRTGRFLLLLDGVTTGEHTFDIDARTANRPNRTYGFYEVRWGIHAGRTNVLPFTIWSPVLDTGHQVTIPSPTTQETVVTTPLIPGLELHLPAGTTIVDEDHQVVRTVSITPIPLDRTPFPLPDDATFTMFFTIQPGGAYLQTAGSSKGGWLVYPRAQHAPAGQRVQFFNYDPDDKGWYVYGMGTAEATRIVPEPRTRIYGFTGTSFNDDNAAPPARWSPAGDCCRTGGDPVDLATGIFEYAMTDVAIPDVMPLVLTRSYSSADPAVRAFGRGMRDPYRIFLYTELAFQEADLILPNGARIHYVRTSAPGLPWNQTEFEHTTSPTGFYKSTITFNSADNGWHLRLKDGTVYVFGHMAPLQAIRDRNGNETRLTWSGTNQFGLGNGNLVRVTSPNGRWLEFSYYTGSPRVSQAKDNIGRTWTYGYDANENLTTVTDPLNHTTTYLYNATNQMTGVRPRNLEGTTTNLVTNEYTTATDAPTPVGWVKKQTHADGGVYQFAYTVSNGKSTQTDLTDPRGYIRRLTMNPDGYTVEDKRAFGRPDEEQTTRSVRDANSNFISSSIDALAKETIIHRDAMGNVAFITRLPGAALEQTIRFTYEPVFQQVKTITDPLLHVRTLDYDSRGNMISTTDPLNHQTTYTYNSLGQRTSVTDALQHVTLYTYSGGDLVTVRNPLGLESTSLFDAVGRLLLRRDQMGRTTHYESDLLGRLVRITDSANGTTAFTYFPDSQLQSVVDALQNTTTYTYDGMGQLATRQDPLLRVETFQHDLSGNLSAHIDRQGQVTTYSSDAINRLHQITYNNGSTIIYGYDDGGRLTSITDSLNGSVALVYDDLDRLSSETTSQGTVTYTYDVADRRATMTLTGRPAVEYVHDPADRLTSISQGAAVVWLSYDELNRRTAVTLPNGAVTEYEYDAASRLSALVYRAAAAIGNVTYAYDANDNRLQVGGSFARTALPQAVSTTTHDPANRLTQWGDTKMTFDYNGNMTTDGLASYIWNDRGQLSAISGNFAASFQYDPLGRRTARSIGGLVVQFLYDDQNPIYEMISGVPSADILAGLDVDHWLVRNDASGTHAVLSDALGSVIALTDASAAVSSQVTYEPFGATIISGVQAEPWVNFTGRENDGSGVYYYRARYYQPAIGRFISEDPGELSGANLYAYVGNSPTNFTDPFGLYKTSQSCKLDQAQQIADGVDEARRKLMEECCAGADGPKLINQIDKAKYICKPTNVGGGQALCGQAPKRPISFVARRIYLMEDAFDPSSGCGDVSCTIIHEAVHLMQWVGGGKGDEDRARTTEARCCSK